MTLRGKLVFSSGRTADFDIWTLDLGTGALKQLTRGKDLNDSPRWSPDGSQIAYVSIGSDLISSLHVMDADGKNLRRLTEGMHSQHPCWTPDGKGIVFTANAKNGEEIEICKCDLSSGKTAVLVSRPGQEAEPCLSPDGKKLLFSAVDPKSKEPFVHRDTQIWEYDLTTKTEKSLFAHPSRDYAPTYSPDGKKIAFVSHRNDMKEADLRAKLASIQHGLVTKDRASVDKAIHALRALEGDADIFVADANGENIRQLTTNGGADLGARWSPCSNYLVYSASPKGEIAKERLRIVDVKTGENVPFEYDRGQMMREIDADPERYLNNHLFLYLVPDFIERPVKMLFIGAAFWGEEHQPDWTYA